MSELLPPNATPQESALDDVTARIGDVPVPVRSVWDPDTCPAHVLPWLAWAFSVDRWDPDWSLAQKRQTVRSALDIHRRKGTFGAVKRALTAIGITPTVLEWHRQSPPGEPFTYRLLIDVQSNAGSMKALREVIDAVDGAKSLRSHLDQVEVSVVSRAVPQMLAAASIGTEISVSFQPRVATASEQRLVVV